MSRRLAPERRVRQGWRAAGLAFAFVAPAWAGAQAATSPVGLTEIDSIDHQGPVTVFYPTSDVAKPLKRGSFTLDVAWQ